MPAASAARTIPGWTRIEYADERRTAVARLPSPLSQAPTTRNSPNSIAPSAASTSSDVEMAQTLSAIA